MVDINTQILPVLKSVIRKNGKDHGKYFFGDLDEPLVNDKAITDAFSKCRKAANLPDGLKLHSLRHTFISYLLKSGANLKYVMDQAGQRQLRTIQRYVHAIPDENPAVELLDYGISLDTGTPE